jgi:hypothetical protein
MLGLLLLLASSCPDPVPRNCTTRIPYYPDADQDGFGEPTAVFYGCEAPDGWVSVLPPEDTGETAPTGDTGQTTPTGDTGETVPTGDTGPTGTTGTTGATGDTASPADTSDTASPGGTASTGDTAASETADTGS